MLLFTYYTFKQVLKSLICLIWSKLYSTFMTQSLGFANKCALYGKRSVAEVETTHQVFIYKLCTYQYHAPTLPLEQCRRFDRV